jgi:hypothetical protein
MFKRRIIYQGATESANFIEALPKKLTLAQPNKYTFESYRNTLETLFNEVKVKPYEPTETELEILNTKGKPFEDIYDMFYELGEAIKRQWGTLNACAHSSGYDSRILSKLFKMQAKEPLYIEWMGEGKEFEQIADIQDFKYLLIYQAETGNHFDNFFDFVNFYEKFNGVSSFPINIWFDFYRLAELKNNAYFSGYGGNETQELALRSFNFGWYFAWHYRLQLNIFNEWGEWKYPNWDKQFLIRLKESKHLVTDERLAERLCKVFVPELNQVRKLSTKDMLPLRVVGSERMKQIVKDYESSWYGQRVKATPTDLIKYDPFWYHYNAASLCEHLIKHGYEIN